MRESLAAAVRATGGSTAVILIAALGCSTQRRQPPAAAPLTPVMVAAISADPSLSQGDSGDSVRLLQDLLDESRRENGYGHLGIDGDFGPGTAAAVRTFQSDQGLSATGDVDPQTWSALFQSISGSPLGTIDPVGAATAGDIYSRVGIHDVEIHVLPTNDLLFESKMSVDADGSGSAWKSDPAGQPKTSLRWSNGVSLDPTVTPYFVLPGGFTSAHPDVHLGDVGAVIYRGQVVYAIYGDVGPHGKIGEGSIALARALGINPSPTSGGVSSGVIYIVFPGSGSGTALTNDDIANRASALLQAAGGNP